MSGKEKPKTEYMTKTNAEIGKGSYRGITMLSSGRWKWEATPYHSAD